LRQAKRLFLKAGFRRRRALIDSRKGVSDQQGIRDLLLTQR
jgi:hypothetical protein